MTDSRVHLTLSAQESLVLFDFLSRFEKSGDLSIHDQADERVLWDLQAQLETLLTEPLRGNYESTLGAARLALRDQEEAGDA